MIRKITEKIVLLTGAAGVAMLCFRFARLVAAVPVMIRALKERKERKRN